MKNHILLNAWRAFAVSCSGVLSACSSTPYIQTPIGVAPNEPPAYVERVNNGSIYQPGMSAASLFSGERRPRNIGDTLKIDIAEKFSASRKVDTNTSRENKVAAKGPGNGPKGEGNLLDRMVNMNASASGSDSYKGEGSTENSSAFTAEITASVVSVLPNGHLVVSGERSVSLNGGIGTLRFAGTVNPKDIKAGNVVVSGDVLNAKLEIGGQGDVADAASRSWLQRFLTKTLTVW